MNTNILILLDQRRQKKDKTYPLILRIIHDRKSISIPLGYSLLEKDWNERTGTIKKTSKIVSNITRLNNILQKQKTRALDIITQLQDSREIETLTPKEIKDRISNKSANITFFQFTARLIQEMNETRKFGNARVYTDSQRAFNVFTKGKDKRFEEINYKLIVKFENFCIAKGNSTNTISVYLRTIRAIYNKAIKENIVKQDYYPFRNYSIKNVKTQKRAVKKEVIETIENLQFEPYSTIWHYKNYFLFSFYGMGLNFADMAHLKMNSISNDRIIYSRQKTGKEYNIKITTKIQDILRHYIKGKKSDSYIFPIIKRSENPQMAYQDILSSRRNYNKGLKEIAELCGLENNLTSYVSRHSWATIAKRKGVPIAVISEGLGHESESTTQIYLDSFDTEVLDDYNEMITG